MSTAPSPTSPAAAPAAAPAADALTGTIFDFTPVPMARVRADGWTPTTQRRFIQALALGGEALGFVRAWDAAVDEGRSRQFDVLMDRAINGVTTIRILRSGAVTVAGGPDVGLSRAAMRDPPAPPANLA